MIAATCLVCGHLKDGASFPRYRRKSDDPRKYLDRRCETCRWRAMEDKRGRV